MKKYEKEVIQAQLDNEKAVLKLLESNYNDALEEINSKIAMLMGRADADMQHVIYQVEYQKALKAQIEGILLTLQTNEFETVSEYLTKCYEEGFLGTMYSLQNQGVPLVMPINQEEIAAAILHETNLSTSLYGAFDIKDLQKKLAAEISRGFATASTYSEITRNVAASANISKNKAKRIVRTEGHRITETAAYNAQLKARDRGADVVKIWDAALDAKTRDSHAKVDGEIRELEKKFSNGLMFPGDPSGKAAEVINCRCRSRTDARWALDADQTKMLGDTSKLSQAQRKAIADKLGIDEQDLDMYSGQIVPIKAKNYADFKRQYDKLWHYEGSDLQQEAEARIAGYGKAATRKMAADSGLSNDWSKTAARNLTKAEKSELIQYAKEHGVNIPDLKQFDGDPDLLKSEIDTLAKVQSEFPLGKKVVMSVSQAMPDDEFASITGSHITMNAKALRDRAITESNIALGGQFASSTVEDIVVHEYGHLITTTKGNKGLEIAEKAYYNVFGKKANTDDLLDFLDGNVSPYSTTFRGGSKGEYKRKYTEVISEVLAKNNSKPDDFTKEFVKLLKGGLFQ